MVDVVMALVVLEGVVLTALGRAAILANLAAGFMLIVAMRLALGGAALPWVGGALLFAGVAHAADLRRTLSLRKRAG